MPKSILLFIIQIIFFQFEPGAQSTIKFNAFQGTVYDIPGDYLSRGYGKYLSYCDILGHVTMDSLVVPRAFVNAKYFPGVTARTGYGIVFESSLDVSEKGCYEFSLESDDGSILWIADSIVIDNDKPHKMIVKRDTMMMDRGQYAVRVWYYSAFESQFGLILRAKSIADSIGCHQEKSMELKRKLSIDFNNVFFDYNAYSITTQGMKELDKLCDELQKADIRKIHIIGYTDNSGTAEYNEVLSLKRAQTISSYMKTKLHKVGVVFEAEGRGSANPVAGVQKADAQKINRRVEIYLE